MESRAELTIVVPCFNEAENVEKFKQEVSRVIAPTGIKLELVFVDDGSKDDTMTEIQKCFFGNRGGGLLVLSAGCQLLEELRKRSGYACRTQGIKWRADRNSGWRSSAAA